MTSIANLGKWEMIFFFSGPDIVRACNFREFESLGEGAQRLSEFSDQLVRAAYVKVSGHKAVQALVFFTFAVDGQGKVDPDWQMPLQRLADTAGRGPNMGGGRIHLACRSQCPISWHQKSLWDPTTGDFSAIRRVVSQRIGKVDEQKPAQVKDPEQIQRQYRNDAITYKNQMQAMQQEMERQKVISEHRGDQGGIEKLKRQLRNLQQTHKQREENLMLQITRLQIKNKQLNDQLQEQTPQEGGFDLGAQLAEMVAHEKNVDQMQTRVQVLEAQLVSDSQPKEDDLLSRVQALGGVMVVYHPGAGHINVPIDELEDYIANPMAIAAQKCQVPESHYCRWLAHQDAPACLQCRKSLPSVDSPGDFIQGQSDYCELHQQLSSSHN